jgi:AcrR family transcriptional regulator
MAADEVQNCFHRQNDGNVRNWHSPDLTAKVAAMAKGMIDRRVARTRATLQHALMSLARKKGYDAVTVEDICEAANVGRSTFYGHYASKDDLKRSGLEHLRRALFEHQENALAASDDVGERCFAFSLPMFEHAREHVETYRSLVGTRGCEVALGAIREILSNLFRKELAVNPGGTSGDVMPGELAVQIAVGAYMTLLTWWLDSGARLPPHQIDALFRRLATKGMFHEHQ